jgi:hypothetical protein
MKLRPTKHSIERYAERWMGVGHENLDKRKLDQAEKELKQRASSCSMITIKKLARSTKLVKGNGGLHLIVENGAIRTVLPKGKVEGCPCTNCSMEVNHVTATCAGKSVPKV